MQKLLLLLPLPFFLAGCTDLDVNDVFAPYRQDFQYSYPLTANGTLQVENSNGSVEVSGWDQNTVEIHGTKYAQTDAQLSETKIDIAAVPGAIAIRTVAPSNRFGHFGARYVIHAPKSAILSSVGTSNGAISVDSIAGPAFLKTSNGSVRASRVEGGVQIETSNGPVDLEEGTGDASIRTSNAGVRADLHQGGLRARTTNGGIDVRLRDPGTKPVRLESSNGHIELTMDSPRPVSADTSNASITVRMPESMSANVRAQTNNASVTSDFSIRAGGGFSSRHRLEGVIGQGGPLLELNTSNAGIRLSRM